MKINFIKKLICKHEWIKVNEFKQVLSSSIYNECIVYGCIKCGKVEEVKSHNVPTWRFKKINKGEKFGEESE